MNSPKLILVNDKDEEIGSLDKLEAHQRGLLHRAFSVFIFSSDGKMLLQQRSFSKYHSGGLWSNACCSHPAPGESTLGSAIKRLQEEMGIETQLEKIFDFTYKAVFENGLIEHEFDHVFAGEYDGDITIHPGEVNDYIYLTMPDLKKMIDEEPGKMTAWFLLSFPKIEEWWAIKYGR
jgi:isopentenyl-diphosphate delta-isomerase